MSGEDTVGAPPRQPMAVVMHREEVDLSLRSLDSEMLDAVWPQVEEHAGKLVCLSLDNNLLHRVPASLCHFHQLRWLHLNECAPGSFFDGGVGLT